MKQITYNNSIDSVLAELVASAKEQLEKSGIDGLEKFKYEFKLNRKVEDKDKRPEIVFTSLAWDKMFALVDGFTSEIAWHGLARRTDNLHIEVYDILIYPQEVTGSTVSTDQVAYQNWLNGIEDEPFNAMHFQGHSHVNMAPNPSPIDLSNIDRTIDTINDNNWYVFMIVNKSRKFTVRYYDKAENIMYDTDDIDVIYEINEAAEFLDEAKKIVTTKTYKPTTSVASASTVKQDTAKFSGYGVEAYKNGVHGWYDSKNVFHPYYQPDDGKKKKDKGKDKDKKVDTHLGNYGDVNNATTEYEDDDDATFDALINQYYGM